MKHIFSIITLILISQMSHAQTNNESYEKLWNSVKNYEKDALSKSALIVVEKITAKAKKENNSPQAIKALLFTSKYALTLEENAQLKVINDFKQKIIASEVPTKNIMESYLANLYWQYYQQNRYKFHNRTKTESKIDSTDFRTWDLDTLFGEINHHFTNSLKNSAALQSIDINDFKEILNTQKGSKKYRPTLFDQLAHNALSFYKTPENSITRPADKFEIDNPELLCEASGYITHHIKTVDLTSLQLKALQVYQELLKFHTANNNLAALVEVDIERLKYIHTQATFGNKDQLFHDALTNSSEVISEKTEAGLYQYEIANLFNQWGNSYSKDNVTYQWKHKEAVELCNEIINAFPNSRAADKCADLKSNIFEKTLQLTAEQFVPINKPARVLVNYKNHDELHLRALKISNKNFAKLERLFPEAKKLAFINKLIKVKSWEATLKNEGDFQNHGIEIVLPQLPNDQYIILATPKDNSNSFAYANIQVTNHSLVETRSQTHHIFQVIDRNNGEPRKNAQLEITYQEDYDRAFISKSFATDAIGMVKIPLPSKRWTSVKTTVSTADDTAYFGDFYINQKRKPNDSHKINYTTFLFTDRGIYRPGQPLYFKGIVVKRENESSTIQPSTKVTITLRDANYQEVSKQNFVTNEYGSLTGEFIVPNNGLTGNYSLLVSSKELKINGSTDFSVEEYKRPKFETSFEPITESYKVNDSVLVKGKAIAYAGSNITDAKVIYRVKRIVHYPRWFYWYRSYFNSSPQEIVHGETTTDASGNYEIKFSALPDNSAKKENLPVFNYEVTADVTDINGETHSTTTTVRVGYHAMTAQIIAQENLNKEKKDNHITISAQNLNGQLVPAKGVLKIYKLKSPQNVLRKRPWEAPDYEGFSKNEFNTLFPHDAFKNEDIPSNWKKGKLVFDQSFDTEKSTEQKLENIKKWGSGKYIVVIETQDKFGFPVKDITTTTLYSYRDKAPADNQLFQIKTNKNSYEIGDAVELTLASSAQDLNITLSIEKDRKIIKTQIIKLNNNSKTVTIPVLNDDLGGFAVNYSYSTYNSFSSSSIPISVPYPKTDLEIETLTFRDKLQPGTEETWNFKIKGPQGDKVSAELLASMYDASLDTFKDHYWSFYPIHKPTYYSQYYSNANQSFGTVSFRTHNAYAYKNQYTPQHFDTFDWFGFHFGYGNRLSMYRETSMMRKNSAPPPVMEVMNDSANLDEENDVEPVISFSKYNSTENQGVDNSVKETKQDTNLGDVQVRKNLQETAFFFPQLQTDKEGNVSFNFTTPEALTKWKVQLLAHTKTLQSAMTTLETVTQKELMVIPNAPRFLREGDKIYISTKIANLTDKSLSGIAKLELTDALTGKSIAQKLLISDVKIPKDGGNSTGGQSFQVDSLGNTQVSWQLKIPADIQAVQYKVIAKTGDFSDGEQNVLPVLTNRMLVTETMPMWVRSNETKTFVLDKLKDNASTSLKHHKLSLEITSNPAWYAIQALPYLMEYPYDCNEQIFSRYYANTLASHIANNNPRIQEVFEQWANSDALLSNLEKNQELKSILIQETPWLRNAQSETEHKKRISLLFNLNKMKNEQAIALTKLNQNQMSSGAWSWFKGGRENRFITQHIISGLGHLNNLEVTSSDSKLQNKMIANAISYLDQEFVAEYNRMKKHAANINDNHLSNTQIHYLYLRSFYPQIKTSKKVEGIMAYYEGQAKKYWVKRSLYAKGMLALILYRKGEEKTANKILRSLKENSILSDEMGMYWKVNTGSWFWHQAPIETQALLIEAFSEIENDNTTIDNLKIWLLKNKQTNQWKTTKATTEAVYALLLQGSDWLSVTDAVDVLVGGEKIDPNKLEGVKVEAGTGYYKTAWNQNQIKPEKAEIQLSKKGKGIAWGSLYWQYFEDLDKITFAETPLALKKKLFLRKYTDTGEVISEITNKSTLKVGDLVRIRIELKADRPMEFVHMKDMRASGLEPINVLSQYKWQDGLGYYESTKDASTNFFFDYLPKGVFVFEYDLRVNNAGNFSNGITTIKSMYAPEFTSHSEGIRMTVE